jgi:aspartate ammonia-lyase
MVCFQVLGGDLAVSAAAQAGQLELNVMMPVIAFNLHGMIELLANALSQVSAKCLAGIGASAGRCREYAEKTLGSATALSVHVGYARAAEIARAALASGKTLRQVALEQEILSPAEAERVLDPERLANPHRK